MKIEYFFLLFGLYIFGAGIYTYLTRRQAEHWLRTTAVITYSDITRNFINNSSKYSEDFECRYRFTVNGEIFEGTSLMAGAASAWSTSFPGISSAQRNADMYPEGESVTVYYDPNNPDRNALEQGNKLAGIGIAVFGFAITAVALSVVFAMWS